MKFTFEYYLMLCLIFLGCTFNSDKHNFRQTEVSVNISTAKNLKAYLIKLSYGNEKRIIVDSQLISSVYDTLKFEVPFESDRQYEIEISKSHKTFDFIPDAKQIKIFINNINGNYVIEGSPASNSLKEFKELQSGLSNKIDLINKKNKSQQLITDSLAKIIEQNNYNYADTVSNAAAFIYVFGFINFNKDYTGLKNFVNLAVKRFPQSSNVSLIQKQSLSMIDIYEKEYKPGNILPFISLPDENGNIFSTASLKGKYYLISFWAPWYTKTYSYISAAQKVRDLYSPQQLQIVNVAFDDDKENWERMISIKNIGGTNLLDEQMWQGIAANTLKFDSIPFNFFVDKNGIILDKAIKPDSLIFVLKRNLH